MSKHDHWFPLYVADYLADTAHLTTAEHGAYLLLLMHQWRNGSVPADEAQQARIVRASLPEWRRISGNIIAYFTPTSSGLLQMRLERERERAAQHAERRAKAGKKGAEGRWQRDGKRMANACDSHSDRIADALANACATQPHLQIDTSLQSVSITQARPAAASAAEFEGWWAAYPRKVGKDAARKSYAAAVKRGATPEELLAALHRQRWPEELRFIPHAATWLNQGRWQDDPGAAAPPEPTHGYGPLPQRPGKLDWLIRDMAAEAREAEPSPIIVEPRRLI